MNLNIRSGLKVYVKKEDGATDTISQVGTVDRMDGGHYIKLMAYDSYDGKHHWIPLKWVVKADKQIIYLNKTRKQFQELQLS